MAYVRKTKDEWTLYANYGNGWESEISADTFKEIKEYRRNYVENAPQYAYRIGRKRVKIENGEMSPKSFAYHMSRTCGVCGFHLKSCTCTADHTSTFESQLDKSVYDTVYNEIMPDHLQCGVCGCVYNVNRPHTHGLLRLV